VGQGDLTQPAMQAPTLHLPAAEPHWTRPLLSLERLTSAPSGALAQACSSSGMPFPHSHELLHSSPSLALSAQSTSLILHSQGRCVPVPSDA
jgi:hypothetical protein